MENQVLVVGAGPVGLTMALELARYGVAVRIIDRIADAEHSSRAVAVWPRTLELLDRSGISSALVELGNKVTVANILSGGKPVASVSLEQIPSPYPFVLMVPQYETEAVLPFPSTQMAVFYHADGPLLFFPMAPDRARVITSLGPATGSPPAALDQQAFQKLIEARGPGGITLTGTVWTSAFHINERQVDSYRSGRVFLAGDAAHIHSPAGGQGMNTGMQDAVNLAWKLAQVSLGKAAGAATLDSYDAERRPVGAQVIEASGRMTRMATLSNTTLQHLRDVMVHLLLGVPPVERALTGLMSEVSVGYPESPLNGPSLGGAKPGPRVPPVVGAPPFGSGRVPLFAACGGEGAASLAARFAGLAEARQALPGSEHLLSLVRPDGYLAAQGPDEDWVLMVPLLARLQAAG